MILLMAVNLIEDRGPRVGLGVGGDCVVVWEEVKEELEEGRVLYVWGGEEGAAG